ncbi:hypothetical protein [Pandoraea sp.]|uniref:hypothetical protein n=1 Tax=Pandoraea sp. TaxID=1883445 RepID=UPI0035AFECF3
MHKPTQALERASRELSAASDVLTQARALFAAIEHAVAGGASVDIAALAQVGADLSRAYSERFEGESEWFEGVRHA